MANTTARARSVLVPADAGAGHGRTRRSPASRSRPVTWRPNSMREVELLGDAPVVPQRLDSGRLLVGRHQRHAPDLEQFRRREKRHVHRELINRVHQHALFEDRVVQSRLPRGNRRRQPRGAGADDDEIAHRHCVIIPAVLSADVPSAGCRAWCLCEVPGALPTCRVRALQVRVSARRALHRPARSTAHGTGTARGCTTHGIRSHASLVRRSRARSALLARHRRADAAAPSARPTCSTSSGPPIRRSRRTARPWRSCASRPTASATRTRRRSGSCRPTAARRGR